MSGGIRYIDYMIRIQPHSRDSAMLNPQHPIIMEEVTDPEEVAKARARRAQFDRNSEWLQTQVAEIYAKHRGKVICIAGQELFIGDTVEEAIDQARAAHPEDEGMFTRYIPKEKAIRIYANQRTVAIRR